MFYSLYVNKEDAKEVLKRQKLQMSIVLFSIGVIVELMSYLVMPRLTNLYLDMGLEIPMVSQLMTKYSAYFVVAMGLMAIYISSNNFLDREFEEKLSAYKDGEKIETSHLINNNINSAIMLLMGLMVGFLVVAIILPIYNLTNSF